MNLQDEIDKKANLWIIKENESLSKSEKEELELWLKNKNHQKAYLENKNLIQDCLTLDDDFINEIENEISEENEKNSIFHRSKYLAASIIICCIVVFSIFEINNYFLPTFEQNFVSSNKKILNISLPDDSLVDLDVKTKVEIIYYEDKRTVDLINGKALFQVTKNKSKPFLVKAGNTLVEVLGTKFEVINLNKTTTINVLEGLVRVNHIYNEKGDKRALIQLKKSQSFSLNNSGKVLSNEKIQIDKIANWKNDIIKFNKTTLKEASVIFQRYSNQKIEFETYELSQLKISGKFSTLHYETFLESIELIYPVTIIKNKKNIKIVKK